MSGLDNILESTYGSTFKLAEGIYKKIGSQLRNKHVGHWLFEHPDLLKSHVNRFCYRVNTYTSYSHDNGTEVSFYTIEIQTLYCVQDQFVAPANAVREMTEDEKVTGYNKYINADFYDGIQIYVGPNNVFSVCRLLDLNTIYPHGASFFQAANALRVCEALSMLHMLTLLRYQQDDDYEGLLTAITPDPKYSN